MAALTSLMTRFCAGEDSWLARSGTSDPGTSKSEMATGSRDAIKTSVETMKTAQITRRSMPDSGALDPVNGKRYLKAAEMDRPA